jgi:hypothetical protein
LSQGTRRRNAALKKHFRPAAPTSEAPPKIKLWPTSNPDHAIIWWGAQIEKPLFVYFIQDANGPIKIGKAYDPRARLTELQCGNPNPLKLVAVVLAAPNTERRLHAGWDAYHLQGEWFASESAPHISTGLIELAKRTQRQQIEAFKRNMPVIDVQAMPVDQITRNARLAMKVRVKL